jgi:N-sulfoglucosamine sulfohydrolase
MNRREFARSAVAGMLGGAVGSRFGFAAGEEGNNLNVLLFTADDLGPDSVGVGALGGMVPDLTPNLDRFAAQSLRFRHAHVTAAICVPSRGCLATGLYGHNSGVYGFIKTERDVPTVMETLGDAGYMTGVLGKVGHSTPKASYEWDYSQDQPDLGAGRSPTRYYECATEFLGKCKEQQKPFYFMVNSHDPHRPFQPPDGPVPNAAEMPSRLHDPEEIHVPGYLPDLPLVREELSHYYNSTRRLDDTFGRVMQALRESGLADNTVVMFLSDNGIAVPFSKCNCYLASTHTPWMVHWPGVVEPGSVDEEHFISGIDFFPTVLEATGLPVPDGLDGRSFLPLLTGGSQDGREDVFTQIDYKAGGAAVPMRCIQDERYGYLFNAWSDGETVYKNNNEGLSMKAMNEAAATDPAVAERVRMFRYRATEEFYDLAQDPDCLNNLMDRPEHKGLIKEYQAKLRSRMVESDDPLLLTFDKRSDPVQMKAELAASYVPRCPPKQKAPKEKTPRQQRRKQTPAEA